MTTTESVVTIESTRSASAASERPSDNRSAELPWGPLWDVHFATHSAAERDNDPTQSWFWTREWQDGEREATADIEAGRTTVFLSSEDFLRSLDR